MAHSELQNARRDRVFPDHRAGIAALDAAFEPAQDRALELGGDRAQPALGRDHDHVVFLQVFRRVENDPQVRARAAFHEAQAKRREVARELAHHLVAHGALAAHEGDRNARRLEQGARRCGEARGDVARVGPYRAPQPAAQVGQRSAHRGPLAMPRRLGDEAGLGAVGPEARDALHRPARVVVPERAEPCRTIGRELAGLDRVHQGVAEEDLGRAFEQVLGAQVASQPPAVIAADAHAHEARPADLVVPGEHAAPGAAVLGREVHELQIEIVAEARHRARHAAERRRRHDELDLGGRALREAVAFAEQTPAQARAAQAVEQCLGDVAAVVHYAGLRTVPTTRALQCTRRSRKRSRAILFGRFTTTSAPPAKAAKSWRSGPRAAAGVSTRITR